jgi:hypothetical protein
MAPSRVGPYASLRRLKIGGPWKIRAEKTFDRQQVLVGAQPTSLAPAVFRLRGRGWPKTARNIMEGTHMSVVATSSAIEVSEAPRT